LGRRRSARVRTVVSNKDKKEKGELNRIASVCENDVRGKKATTSTRAKRIFFAQNKKKKGVSRGPCC